MTLTLTEANGVLAPSLRRLRVGDQWSHALTGRTFPVEDPATGSVIAEVPDASAADALAALDAAHVAQPGWAATPARVRSEILQRTFAALLEHREEIARLITWEMGKALRESRAEVSYSAEFFRWFAEEAVRIEGRYSQAPAGGYRILTQHRPVGPCVLVTPWNFPMAMGARKIAPALAAGCTVVVKPAEQTPLSMLLLARLLEEAGAPAGTVNVVTTASPGPVVDALLADPRTRKLSFTGSTEVGRLLLRTASENILRTSMELGGNAAFIVCADADLEAAVQGAMVAKMRNIGESCVAANRFYVHESLADEFASRLAVKMDELTVGPGLDEANDVGPLIDTDATTKIERLVADATARGAAITTGGSRPDRPGHFFTPTVLQHVPADAQMLSEEIFGPVAPISSFAGDDEAVAHANGTPYGLVAYVYTRDLRRALRYTETLEVGMVGVNRGLVSEVAAPFGGVKHSGLGREGSHEGIAEYLETVYSAIDLV